MVHVGDTGRRPLGPTFAVTLLIGMLPIACCTNCLEAIFRAVQAAMIMQKSNVNRP
jgi:hypothetical protein